MATKTPNLSLIKPARGEYEGTWDIPMNKNSDTVDGAIGDIQNETQAARGSKASIDARLSVALGADGVPLPLADIVSAQVSAVYGFPDTALQPKYKLDSRLEQGDRETYDARQGGATLRDGLASVIDDVVHNSVVSAPTGFFSFTGANVKVDGSVTPVVCNINGYRQVVRTQKSIAISGAAATYYVYLQRSATGDIYLDRTGVGQNNGVTSIDGGSGLTKNFSDSSQNFITSGVTQGDILEITTVGSVNKDQYVVDSVVDANNLLIKGDFRSVLSNLNYKITNPIAPSLLFTATAHAKRWQRVSGLIYIGRAVFDGANVTSVTTYAVKGRFELFSSISGDFALTVSHNIGYVPHKVQFFGSQANDHSAVIEPLSDGDMVTSTLLRSVISKIDDMTVSVKNTTSGTFYKGYDGTTFTSGYLLIVAER
jgi:hypothetical protein